MALINKIRVLFSEVVGALGYTPENPANKGIANGYAGLDASGRVPAGQLPSYVDDVQEFPNLASFPNPGSSGIIYLALDTNIIYRWGGSTYIEISSGDVAWVDVTGKPAFGTMSLQDASNVNITGGVASVTSSVIGNLTLSANQITSIEASDDILVTPTGIGALKVQNRITLEDTLSFGPLDPQGSYFANNAEYLQAGPLSAWQYLQNGTATKVEFDNGAAMTISNAPSGNQGDFVLGWTEVLNISSAGDVVTGNWTAGVIDSTYGGTGVNNGGNLLNITANASISGSNTGDQIITLTGDVTGSGTGSFAATLANTTVTAGTYGSATQVPQFTVNAKGQLTGVSNLSVDDSTKLPLSGGTMTGNIAFAGSQPWPTFNQNTTGNAATATALQTPRTINGVSFNGTSNIILTANTTQALTISGPLTGGPFNGGTATTLGIQTANGTQAGALSSTDWTTFNNKQAAISLTTAGSSGEATFTSNTLNVPNYTLSGLGGISASSADTLTNKTLIDSTTFLQDDADNTKKAQFQLSSIATATTRTFTLPNVNGTLVTTGDTGSVTNAMLAGSIADSKLSTISTAGKVSNSATTATNANTANAIVERDANGNFSAGTITASLSGNSATATTLETARNINGVAFNGSADITVEDDTKLPLGGGTLTGQLKSTRANNTATGAGQIFLNGATGNRIDFNQNGTAAPSFGTRSEGTKLVLNPQIGASSVDFGIGIAPSTFWFSVPSDTRQFVYYAGTTVISRLRQTGLSTSGVVYQGEEAITARHSGGTLTIEQILTLVIRSTPTANITFTLPTGTLTDAGVMASLETNRSFTWSITNTALSFTITMAGAVGHTYFGNTTIAANTSASFRTIKNATNTFTTYRI